MAFPAAVLYQHRHLPDSGLSSGYDSQKPRYGTGKLYCIYFHPSHVDELSVKNPGLADSAGKSGVINGILTALHLPRQNLINTPGAIVLGMVYNFLPFMVLPIYNVLCKIEDNTINAARDLGANFSRPSSGSGFL